MKILVGFLIIAFSMCAFADEALPRAKITFEKDSSKKMKDLEWTMGNEVEVGFRKKQNSPIDDYEVYVTVSGKFTRPEYVLVLEEKQIERDGPENFSREVVIPTDVKTVKFTVIGPLGNFETESFEIRIPEFSSLKEKLNDDLPAKKFDFQVGLGPTFIHYTQTGEKDSDQIAATARGGVNYYLNSKWELSSSAFLNLLNFSTSQEDSIRMLGVNLRAGYVFHKPLSPWKWTLNAGVYYVTTFANYIGFENLGGPQVYPTVSYSLGNQKSIFGYLKYSPISKDFSILDLANRELAVGAGYGFPWKGRSWSAGLDFAQIAFKSGLIESEFLSVTAMLNKGI